VLVLFDIDGTLLHGRPEGHTRAMVDAMREVWGVDAQPDDVWGTDPGGRTDREIARLVLRGHGVDDAEIDRLTPQWIVLAGQAHGETAHAHPDPVAAPDADEVTARLLVEGAEIALVTGNLQSIGRAKVAAAGLGHRFGDGGGFGCDSEERADLVRIARERAGRAYADDDVVVVGDTPRDIRAARLAGVRVVAVTTGAHAAPDLAGADAVAPHLTGALAVLLA
jgi:phosphoglycolate phosphatase-like HAD superfamily hydrolase